MRFREFLIEYDRNKTASMVGDKLVLALANDRRRPAVLANMHGKAKMGPSWYTPEQVKEWTDTLLSFIEEKDPTPNKAYTPWLARMYAKGDFPLISLNRGDLLALYDRAKQRRMLRPEDKDINKFETYKQFEDTMLTYDFNKIGAPPPPPGKTAKVYDDANVKIIVPEDEDGSRRIGRGTKWCTAWTNRPSHFNNYNGQGPLYVLVPKHPTHEGEKYQIHFPKSEFKNEENKDVPLNYILMDRFPETLDFFKKAAPELKNKIMFADDETIQNLVDEIKKAGLRYIDSARNNQELMRTLTEKDLDALKYMLNMDNVDEIKEYSKELADKNYFFDMEDVPKVMRLMSKAVTTGNKFVGNFTGGLHNRIKKQGDNWVITQ